MRGRRRQSPLDRAERGCGREGPRTCAGRRTEARVARRFAAARGSAAHAVIDVEKLTSMAHQPEIVKREDNGDAAPGQRSHDVRRQARQVMYVGHVWLEFTDQTVRYSVYRGIPVRLFER